MFYLFHLKSKFSASLSRSHYQSIKNLKAEAQNAKSCHGYIYTVKMVIKIKLKGLNSISVDIYLFKVNTKTVLKVNNRDMNTPSKTSF